MKTIVISLSSKTIAMRECMIGILEYANTQRDWELTILPDTRGETAQGLTPRFVREAMRNGVAGFISGHTIRSAGFDALVSSGLPVVLNNAPSGWNRPKNAPITLIHNDDITIGRTGSRHFLSIGNFRSYGFVREEENNYWGTYRCRGFDLELSRHGIRPHVFDPAQTSLADWLLGLPKPAAVMLSTDLLAADIFSTCRKLHIAIPEQISVLSVDNDELLCKSCNPTLSSIQPGHMEMGRRAAKELHRLMDGKKPNHDIFIPPCGIVDRMSTRSIPPAGHLIENGLAYIREHFRDGISVSDVAKHLKISPSLLRMRFRACHGQSVQNVLLDMRLQAAKELLKDPTLSISDVAERTGFASLGRLSHFFRERLGQSPSKWRKANIIASAIAPFEDGRALCS